MAKATQNRKPVRKSTAQERSMRSQSSSRSTALDRKAKGLRRVVPGGGAGASGSGKI